MESKMMPGNSECLVPCCIISRKNSVNPAFFLKPNSPLAQNLESPPCQLLANYFKKISEIFGLIAT
jgi:hypothetical protein